MKHIVFNSFDDFFAHFDLPKSCSISIGSDNNAYFEFQPYKDGVTIRGWICEFDHTNVIVEFKYRECALGRATWSMEKAKATIKKVDYYYEEYDD